VYSYTIRAVWADDGDRPLKYYFDEIEELFSFKVRWPVSGSVIAQSAQRGTFSTANGAEDARRVKLVLIFFSSLILISI
jgi:hypothetical protein